jgi:hypothetical protein
MKITMTNDEKIGQSLNPKHEKKGPRQEHKRVHFLIKGAKCTHLGQSLPRIQGKNVLTCLIIKVVKWTRWELFKI